jgi:hypothetical protein
VSLSRLSFQIHVAALQLDIVRRIQREKFLLVLSLLQRHQFTTTTTTIIIPIITTTTTTITTIIIITTSTTTTILTNTILHPQDAVTLSSLSVEPSPIAISETNVTPRSHLLTPHHATFSRQCESSHLSFYVPSIGLSLSLAMPSFRAK